MLKSESIATLPTNQQRMVADIRAEAAAAAPWTGSSAISARVLEAMAQIPRHKFVPTASPRAAYDNTPLPIGHGQTISQPYIVALMTDLLQPRPQQVVLEVGTGSGYQAAVLSQLVKQVYTLEIVATLAQQAAERLARLGYNNVEVIRSDGHDGLPQHAPYDAIIVTAAPQQIPQPLIEQLKPGGRLVIPVGGLIYGQDLLLIEKGDDGKISTTTILPVAFVPLITES
jgi:protein-L-isoaspartate(D-aspartate) O-methyltransferase